MTKTGDDYALTPSSRAFLDRHSPAYMGAAVEFLAAPEMNSQFLDDPISYVRNGGSVGLANISADNPVWVKFARGMRSVHGGQHRWRCRRSGQLGETAEEGAEHCRRPWTVRHRDRQDRSVGRNRRGRLEFCSGTRQASCAGIPAWRNVTGRLPAAPLEVDWGGDYDLILLPNFLHHFDMETCAGLLRKVEGSLSAGARSSRWNSCRTRIASALLCGRFHWRMLATTPSGDAYTQKDLNEMAQRAGFRNAAVKPLPPSPASLVFFE